MKGRVRSGTKHLFFSERAFALAAARCGEPEGLSRCPGPSLRFSGSSRERESPVWDMQPDRTNEYGFEVSANETCRGHVS